MSSSAADSDEPARSFPPIPLWSESYAWWTWDDANDLSIYAHFQRHPIKPSLWRASVALSRTEGVYGVNGFGPQFGPHGPGFDALRICVEKPHQRWRLYVDTAAHFRDMEAHQSGPMTDGPATPLSIDLVMDLHPPRWSLTADEAKATMASSEHYEQAGAVTGEVMLGEERFNVNALGANDHSRGVRDFAALKTGGFFLPAAFPSGRTLSASKHSGDPAAPEIGYLGFPDGEVALSNRVTPPRHWPAPGQRDEVIIEAGQHSAKLTITPSHRRVFISIAPPTFEHIGLVQGPAAPLYYCDWSCRVEWDGEVGNGSLQMLRKA